MCLWPAAIACEEALHLGNIVKWLARAASERRCQSEGWVRRVFDAHSGVFSRLASLSPRNEKLSHRPLLLRGPWTQIRNPLPGIWNPWRGFQNPRCLGLLYIGRDDGHCIIRELSTAWCWSSSGDKRLLSINFHWLLFSSVSPLWYMYLQVIQTLSIVTWFLA